MANFPSPLSQEDILEKLKAAHKRADQQLRYKKLHLRTKNPSLLVDNKKMVTEKLRHSLAKYDMASFDREVQRLLGLSPNKTELLASFDYISTGSSPLTMANAMESKMHNLQKIITMLERDGIENYFPKNSFGSKNVCFDKNTSIISYLHNEYPLKKDAKFLIDYLWGKRERTYSSGDPTHKSLKTKESTILYRVGVSGKSLKAIIDNFNDQCNKKDIPAKIRRKSEKVWLEVSDQIPTRN